MSSGGSPVPVPAAAPGRLRPCAAARTVSAFFRVPGRRTTAMTSLLPSLCRAVAATWHRCWGRFWFRLRHQDRARGHFERLLQLRGDDFQAYVFLGRLAYAQGDYSGWRREFEHARRTDPARFERLGEVGDLFVLHGRAGAREAADRATWSRIGVARRDHAGESFPAEGSGESPWWQGAAQGPDHRRTRRLGDDFSSDRERQHFARLAPLTPDDVARVDLDGLARRLGRL